MNKLTKAAIAGGLGIALLLGGAGTLATWNTSANISGGTIVAGSLTIGTATSTGWSVSHGTGTNTTNIPLTLSNNTFTVTSPTAGGTSAFTSSPGDRLIYTSTVPLTVTGTNLAATLSLTSGAIAAVTSTSTATQNANNALASALLNSVAFTASTTSPLTNTALTATPQLYTYNLVTGLQNVTITATMTFPNNPPTGNPLVYSDNLTQGGSVTFAGMAVTLTQTN